MKEMTEIEFIAECARLNQKFFPHKELAEALDKLAKEWLLTHDELPKWW